MHGGQLTLCVVKNLGNGFLWPKGEGNLLNLEKPQLRARVESLGGGR